MYDNIKSICEVLKNWKTYIVKRYQIGDKISPPFKKGRCQIVADPQQFSGDFKSMELKITQELISTDIPPDENMDLTLRDGLIKQIEHIIISRNKNKLDNIDIPYQDQILIGEVKGNEVILFGMKADTNHIPIRFSGKPYPLKTWFISNVLTMEDYYDLEKTLITIM